MSVLTITINEVNSIVPIPGVTVVVYNFELTTIVANGTTNANGIYSPTLSNGDYKIFLNKTGYSFPDSPYDANIEGNVSVTYEGFVLEDLLAPEPVPDGKVKLYGYIKNLLDIPQENETVYIRLAKEPQTVGHTAIYKETVEVLTDENGYFEVLLPARSYVNISIPTTGLTITKILPFEGSFTLSQLDAI